MFEDGLLLMQRLFSGERVSFDDEFYNLEGAVSQPRPVQQAHPPIWLGASGERVMLRLVASVRRRPEYPGLTCRGVRAQA